jgi:sulfide:quinone oxidoreductase
MLHVTPPQSAPDFIQRSPLAWHEGPCKGWVKADKYTLQHPDYPEVFALGDASDLPTSRTGAAIRKQAPVVVENLLAVLAGRKPEARYDGYASCPLTTGYGKLLLAEFDYDGKPTPSFPLINTIQERRDMWLMKKYGLPRLYWGLMLRGRA